MHTAFFIDRTRFSLPDCKARGRVILRPNDPTRACRAGGRGTWPLLLSAEVRPCFAESVEFFPGIMMGRQDEKTSEWP
jgi:hypothetical protein